MDNLEDNIAQKEKKLPYILLFILTIVNILIVVYVFHEPNEYEKTGCRKTKDGTLYCHQICNGEEDTYCSNKNAGDNSSKLMKQE